MAQQQQSGQGGKLPGQQMQSQQAMASGGPGGMGGAGMVSASPPLTGKHSWWLFSEVQSMPARFESVKAYF